jgi:DNA-binding NarL/FixJ family response regulator
MTTARVLVVDDHPMFRDGLCRLIGELSAIELAGQAATGEEALELVAAGEPDVVLMDLHMPGIGGIEATRRLTSEHPDVAVLVLTMMDDDNSLRAAVAAGARGYLLKEATPDEIVGAINSVVSGQAVFGGAIGSRVLAALSARPPAPPLDGITEREQQVLELLARGLTNAAIAERLGLSGKTVRNHVSNLFTKLGVADRAAAVAKARDAGIGPRESRPDR